MLLIRRYIIHALTNLEFLTQNRHLDNLDLNTENAKTIQIHLPLGLIKIDRLYQGLINIEK